MEYPVVIIGAGLSGLSAGTILNKHNIPFIILEADNEVGGRVKTDFFNGFLLDHGFAVLLESYPIVKEMIDYKKLSLKRFIPGTLVRYNNKFYTVADPFKKPLSVFKSIFTPIGSFKDKIKLLRLRFKVTNHPIEKLFQRSDMTTLEVLRREYKFSDSIINRFFKPFMSGVFFDNDLQTSRYRFEFITRMFTTGSVSIPENGIGQIPKQLAEPIIEKIKLNSKVEHIDKDNNIKLSNGEKIKAEKIIIATDGKQASKLNSNIEEVEFNGTINIYFSHSKSPLNKPILIINAEENSFITNLVVLSEVSQNYSPEGKSLISVSITGNSDLSDNDLVLKTKEELTGWFGKEVNDWNFLKLFRIPFGQPIQSSGINFRKKVTLENDKLFVCGDHRDSATFNGALESGKRVAEHIINTYKMNNL